MRIAAWVIGVLLIAGLITWNAYEAQQRDLQTCRETNNSRAVIRTFITAVIDEDGQRSATEVRYLALMDKYLGPRDCEALR